jgi:hypothetical protein
MSPKNVHSFLSTQTMNQLPFPEKAYDEKTLPSVFFIAESASLFEFLFLS